MSSNLKDKKEEEEWEDVEEGEEEEEEEDSTIANPDVVGKYKRAAQWTNEVLKAVVAACKVGAKVTELCTLGDKLIAEKVNSMFKSVEEKGSAFPTCISVNNCVCHNTPLDEESDQVLAENDVVHIDLGIHIDGYPVMVAYTHLVTSADTLPDDKAGNVITAAYTALNAAARKMRPGCSFYDVTAVIEAVAQHFGVTPCEGVLSHEMIRYIVDHYKCFPNKKQQDQMVHDYMFEPLQVWTLDIAFSTGKGKLKEKDSRTSIYMANVEGEYNAKMDSARALQKDVAKRYQFFPFSLRNVDRKAKLGLTELLRHNAMIPYPVLYEREGEVVGHFKITLLITPKKIDRITGMEAQKPAKPIAPFTDEMLLQTLKLPFSLEPKKEKKAKAAE